jgi:hypothetical protein
MNKTQRPRGGVPQHQKDVKTSRDPTIKARETNLVFFFFFTGVINYPKTKGRLEVGDG